MDYNFKLLKSVVEVNRDQRFNIIHKLEAVMNLSGKTIAVWGLAFKPETDDIRESPAIEIIQDLLNKNARVKVYDPIAAENFKQTFSLDVEYSNSAIECAKDADALCILTEWKEFQDISPKTIHSCLRYPVLIDGRNLYSEVEISETELIYYSVGRPNMNKGQREQKPLLSF